MTGSRVVELLKDLVEVETVNDPVRGLRVTRGEGLRIQEILASYGVEMDLLEHNGYPTLLAVKGEGRPVTLFMAHFDVVPPGPGWTVTSPFKPVVVDGYVYGRGAADDKSNVAAIAFALRDYQPVKGTIIVAFTGDEEIGGANGAGMLAQRLEKEGLKPDYLVNGDGSLSRVITRRRSAFTATVSVKEEPAVGSGRTGRREFETRLVLRDTMHSAYFTPGVDMHALVAASLWARDAGFKIARMEGDWVKSNVLPRRVRLEYVEPGVGRITYDEALTRLVDAVLPITRTPIPTEKYSDYGVSINPNLYKPGDTHRLIIDIRAMTTDTASVKESLEDTLKETLPGASLEVKGGSGYLYTSRDARLVKIASEANSLLGLDPEPVEAGGASDSRYFSPRGVEAIDYGPLGYNIHGPDERVSIDHLLKAVRFYRSIAERIHG